MSFKRGTKLKNLETDQVVTILGPEDFEGYAYNKPSEKWELVIIPGLGQVWSPIHAHLDKYEVIT